MYNAVNNKLQVAYVTVLAPYVMIFILLVRGATLEGADVGVKHFITPRLDRLADPKVRKNIAVNSTVSKYRYAVYHDFCYRFGWMLLAKYFTLLEYALASYTVSGATTNLMLIATGI